MVANPRLVKVHITYRHTEPTDALSQMADEKISHCLQKYIHHDTEVNVVMKVEKMRQIAEASFRVDGHDFFACEESADMYASLDSLVTSISRQLVKHKEKITSHK